MDSERLMRRAETHVALRKGFMVVNAVAYIGWMTSLALPGTDLLTAAEWEMVRNISRYVWLLSLVVICTQFGMLKRNRDLAVLVDDERSSEKTALAFKGGYWVLLVAVAVLYLASLLTPAMDMRTFMPLLLAAGVSAPTFAVIFFGKD